MALPANPTVHLRSEDVVTDPVSTWPDQSGNGNDFDQANAIRQPTLAANELNGFQVVRFDGVDQYVRRDITVDQPQTFAVVARSHVASGLRSVMGARDKTANGDFGPHIYFADATLNWRINAGTIFDTGLSVDTDWHIFVAVFDGASSQLDVDDDSFSGDAGTRDGRYYRVGATTDSSDPLRAVRHWDGDIAEVLIYDRALNGTEISDTQDFFTAKYFTAPPSAPTNPAAVAQSDTEIQVTWDNVADETGYRVERSLNGSSGWTDVSGNLAADTVLYDDTGLTASTQYFYRVFAFNAGGDSAASTTVNATTSAASSGNRMGGDRAIRRSPRTPR